MRVTADTNVLVRAIMGDHETQTPIAQAELASADLVALALPALCELAWVLSRGYAVTSTDIAEAIRGLINAENVVVNRPAAQAGLDFMARGGDFADGIIAFEGRSLGADSFLSFDRQAVKLIESSGGLARLLS